jgi:hypothetical protein
MIAAAPARADVEGRLSLTGMILSESQDTGAANPSDAANTLLGYSDLRAVLAGRNLAGGAEFFGDFRLRLSGDFSQADAITGNLPSVVTRGYDGQREYDLRQAWIGRRGDKIDLAFGRIVEREADALRIDGARLTWRFAPGWRASVFGGLFPNPFSRSLTDDYVSATALAGAVGASVQYDYPRLWGSASVVGTLLGGPDDGGPILPTSPNGLSEKEAARVYLTWTNFVRFTSWLDLFHDFVFDVAGSGGAQVTRADLSLNGHFSRLHVAAGYGHYSSLAVEMYLLNLLADRRTFLPGTIENNLIVQRTARDEGRLRADVNPIGHLNVYGDARLRRRALVSPTDDPNFASVQPSTAWDLTLGLRSLGDLKGLRLGAAFTEITDFRAETRLVSVDAGRDFLDGKAAIDLGFVWEGVHDNGAGMSCVSPLDAGCFGAKDGNVYQGGVTLTLLPSRWLILADYRVVVTTNTGAPAILTHIALLRLEVRF